MHFCWRSHENLATEVSRLGPIRRMMLTSKINVYAFRQTEILNNVSESSSFILVSFVSVDRQTFTFAEMSQVFRCTSQKSTLYHDPDCAMRLFVLLLTPTHLLSQNCRGTQPCSCVSVQNCRRPLPNRGQKTHSRNVGSPVANTSSRGPVLNNACTSVLCSFDARFGFGLQPRLTVVLPVSRPPTP